MHNKLLILLFSLLLSSLSFGKVTFDEVKSVAEMEIKAIDEHSHVVVSPIYYQKSSPIKSPFLRKKSVTSKYLGGYRFSLYLTENAFSKRNQFESAMKSIVGDDLITEFNVTNKRPAASTAPPVRNYVLSDQYTKKIYKLMNNKMLTVFKAFFYVFCFFAFFKLMIDFYRRSDNVSLANPVLQGAAGLDKEYLPTDNEEEMVAYHPVNYEEPDVSYDYLGDETLISFFSDCYWCHEDGYAAFVWENISRERRQAILFKQIYFPTYFGFLETVTPRDLKFINDRYYRRPLPVSHLSNEDLLGFIVKDKRIINEVSLLRRKVLIARYKDQIEGVHLTMVDLGIDYSQFKTRMTSELRKLISEPSGYFKSNEAEMAFVNEADDVNLAFSHPSLAWTIYMEDEQVKTILDSFDAFDLASALSGPEEVVNRLVSLLDEKKKKAVVGLIKVAKPSVFSSSYYHMCLKFAEEVAKSEELDHSDQEKAA